MKERSLEKINSSMSPQFLYVPFSQGFTQAREGGRGKGREGERRGGREGSLDHSTLKKPKVKFQQFIYIIICI